jgi:DNA (cytosine-5)-methyltransferase 1
MKTFASLFSGGGGADIGAAMAQFQPIWGIELDLDIAGVFAANLGHQPIVKSVADVNPNSLERPDVLWASPPCQEWSVARSKSLPKRVDADIGYSIIPFLKTLQLKIFILENVEAYRKATVFHTIVNALHQLGYWTSWSVLNMADWGVPQTRRRLILRAVKGVFVPPLPSTQKWMGWYEAIADLIPTLPSASFAPWQIERMPSLAQTSLVDGRNTIRPCTVRSLSEPSPTVTAHWLHRPCVST